ncbi:hypothetical protein VHEMI04646 [[Torrubiella] hemipterigena]|uniref:Uncharacterized protein n=1 Tax=[Torrubiella] hemipterigena TaxID=1531966 RepID=A0A0A1T1V4_9HYPO|nr:hypothetical protein VHEMI04646 [[Torrubiella] hemipterigena]
MSNEENDNYLPFPRPIQVVFGGGITRAIAHLSDARHSNVLRLDLMRTIFQKRIKRVIEYLPVFLQNIVRYLAPQYFLPGTVILKKRKPGWDDEFANEKNIYPNLSVLKRQPYSIVPM